MKVFIKILKIILGIILGLLFSVLTIVGLDAILPSENPFSSSQANLWLLAVIISGWTFFFLWLMMRWKTTLKRIQTEGFDSLPLSISELIDGIIDAMKYRRSVRAEVRQELTDHFTDALAKYADEQDKLKRAEELIGEFGDAKLLAVLIRRGKKRCRPLWKTMLVRMFQAIGILFLLLALYIGWFLSGKPVITTNYLEVLNQTVRPAADDSQNAWPLYKLAAEKYVDCGDTEFDTNPRSLLKLTQEERTILLKWIADNQNSLALVRQGNQKSYYWQIYDTGENKNNALLGMVSPILSESHNIARFLCWQALLDAERGDIQNAFDTALESYTFGCHQRGQNASLIEQLVVMANEMQSTKTFRILLDEDVQNINLPLMDSIRKRFEAMIENEKLAVNFEGEKLFLYDEIQRSFTDSHIGKSHLYLNRIRHLEDMYGQRVLGDYNQTSAISPKMENIIFSKVKRVFQILFTHPDQEQTRKDASNLCVEMSQLAARTPASLKKEGIDIDVPSRQIVQRNILLKILVPAFGFFVQESHRCQADSIATLTIFAIVQYHKAHNAYPDSLDTLIQAGLLEKMPIDPFSDKPLLYRKTDGGFTLYSVGVNFVDDGGVMDKDSQGKPTLWSEQGGDAVFWPVNKE